MDTAGPSDTVVAIYFSACRPIY